MPVLLTALLYSVYALPNAFIWQGDAAIWCFYKIVEIGNPGWPVITLGIVKGREEVKDLIDKVLMYPRVSSQDQEEGTSLAKQNDALYGEAEAVVDENDIIVIGNEWESAATMLRDNIDEIIARVTNSEERYCLMFRNVDRLTRADPFEAATFCWIMKQNDVILYFDDLGYFDFSDLMQEMILMMQFVQSRQEYVKIRNRGSEGRKDVKAAGKYPTNAPFGYDKDEDNVLEVNEYEAEIIRRGAELAIEGDEELGVEAGNVSDVHSQLMNEYGEEYAVYTTLLDIFDREMYTGKLKHADEVVGECPEILSELTFAQLRDTIGERTSETDDQELDHALKQVIDRFGVEASLDMFEEIIKGKCPECGADVRPWGSTERMGHKVKKYRCVNHPAFSEDEDEDTAEGDDEDTVDDDTEECEFEGPLLSGKFLRSWESSVPITCPACQQPLSDEAWEASTNKLGFIEQTCGECGCGVAIDLSQGKFERATEIAEGIHFFGDQSQEPDANGSPTAEEPDDTCDDNGGSNHSLDDYT